MRKRVVFISHITPEKEIALALQELIQASFLGLIEVFVSSDPKSLPAGRKWLDRITGALKACAVEIVIASPASVTRPWINFEAGAAYLRDIPVIPVCHSGMTPGKLPAPLNSLQAVTATEESELNLIVPTLAEAIGSSVPQIDFRDFAAKVRDFEQLSNQITRMAHELPIASWDGLRPHELATLVAIAELSQGPGDSVYDRPLRAEVESAGFTKLACKLALAALQRHEFITIDQEQEGYGDISIVSKLTPEGWAFLETHQDKLVLTIPLEEDRTEPSEESFYDAPAADLPDDSVPF